MRCIPEVYTPLPLSHLTKNSPKKEINNIYIEQRKHKTFGNFLLSKRINLFKN